MKRLVVLCSLLFAAPSLAEPIVAGKRHEGPVRLEVPGLEVSFALPAKVTAVLPPGTEWLHVGRDHQLGRVFVYATAASEADIRAIVAQPFPVADTVVLTPKGTPRKSAHGFVADFYATDGSETYGAYGSVVTTPRGAALVFVAVALPDALPEFAVMADQMAASVKQALAPSAAISPPASSSSGPWVSALADHRVVRYAHGSGYSEKTEFHLCRDGRFSRAFGATSISSLGTGVANAQNRGRWSVQGNVISLLFEDGTQDRAVLEDRGGQLFVNGERWLREPMACR
ncbi:MAG: hypothetical protein ACO3JL_13755 [Myxococcota bacterium]